MAHGMITVHTETAQKETQTQKKRSGSPDFKTISGVAVFGLRRHWLHRTNVSHSQYDKPLHPIPPLLQYVTK